VINQLPLLYAHDKLRTLPSLYNTIALRLLSLQSTLDYLASVYLTIKLIELIQFTAINYLYTTEH
jgi:hypothetical protein